MNAVPSEHEATPVKSHLPDHENDHLSIDSDIACELCT